MTLLLLSWGLGRDIRHLKSFTDFHINDILSSSSYTSSIRRVSKFSMIARLIKYLKVVASIIGEYVSS